MFLMQNLASNFLNPGRISPLIDHFSEQLGLSLLTQSLQAYIKKNDCLNKSILLCFRNQISD